MTWCPLHKAAASACVQPGDWQTANPGLYWNRFFDEREPPDSKSWPQPTEPDKGSAAANDPARDSGKRRWLDRFAGPTRKLGNADQLSDYHSRQVRLLQAQGATLLVLELQSPFVTGLGLPHPVENGLLFHHTLGCPYLPGSSVKGLLRHYLHEEEGWSADALARWFGEAPRGSAGGIGGLAFGDAVPLAPVQAYVDVVTPHVDDWLTTTAPWSAAPGDWLDPVPIPFLAIMPGQRFAFPILHAHRARLRRGPAAIDLATVAAELQCALDWFGAGAKTASGFGRFGVGE